MNRSGFEQGTDLIWRSDTWRVAQGFWGGHCKAADKTKTQRNGSRDWRLPFPGFIFKTDQRTVPWSNQFCLSGQNPERARLNRHYPFWKEPRKRLFFILSNVSWTFWYNPCPLQSACHIGTVLLLHFTSSLLRRQRRAEYWLHNWVPEAQFSMFCSLLLCFKGLITRVLYQVQRYKKHMRLPNVFSCFLAIIYRYAERD